MILPRLLTAIIGIPLILLCIHFGGVSYFLLITVIVLFSLQEYFFIAEKRNYSVQKITGYFFGLLVLSSVFLAGTEIISPGKNQITSIILTMCLIIFFLYEIIISRITNREPHNSIQRISVTFLGIFIICWTFGHLLLLRDIKPDGDKYTYFLFILIWITDTAAYLIGTKFGKHQLARNISPKKTIEGAIGGIIFGVISGIVMWKTFPLKEFSHKEVIVITLVLIILAYISDLSESLLKREAGIKDTDSLLPGHGGFLDRFDSFLFTTPVFYYYISIFHK
ncbi:MAG: phosphatidate cytidylyltransferase [Endomicrobiia bacterium]